MKKGFTLLELVIVLIIVGVLATLAVGQYGRMVERSRGAEARAALGDIRKNATIYVMQNGTIANIGALDLNIGAVGSMDMAPSACRTSHYFSYGWGLASPILTGTATRCTAGGKTPNATLGQTLILQSDFSNGIDTWTGSGPW